MLVSVYMKMWHMNHWSLTKGLTGGGHIYSKHFNEDRDLSGVARKWEASINVDLCISERKKSVPYL